MELYPQHPYQKPGTSFAPRSTSCLIPRECPGVAILPSGFDPCVVRTSSTLCRANCGRISGSSALILPLQLWTLYNCGRVTITYGSCTVVSSIRAADLFATPNHRFLKHTIETLGDRSIHAMTKSLISSSSPLRLAAWRQIVAPHAASPRQLFTTVSSSSQRGAAQDGQVREWLVIIPDNEGVVGLPPRLFHTL